MRGISEVTHSTMHVLFQGKSTSLADCTIFPKMHQRIPRLETQATSESGYWMLAPPGFLCLLGDIGRTQQWCRRFSCQEQEDLTVVGSGKWPKRRGPLIEGQKLPSLREPGTWAKHAESQEDESRGETEIRDAWGNVLGWVSSKASCKPRSCV